MNRRSRRAFKCLVTLGDSTCEMSFAPHETTSPRQRLLTGGELLVALSLLTPLAAIWVPVVAPAGQRDRPLTCLSHLRQMALAASLYAEDEGAGGAVTSYP